MNWKTLIPIVSLCLAACGKGSSGTGGGTVENPVLTADDVSVNEGTGASGSVAIKLKLDKAATKTITLKYSTADGTAKAGEDYTAVTNETITIAPSEIEKTITINVVADDLREPDETFQVKLSDATNVTLMKATINVTLRNDDTKVPFNNAGYEAPATYPGYTLVWSDEFNGTSLDANIWVNETGDGCPALCAWGNNEQQYYTAPPNNLFFQDGKMLIEAKSEAYGGKNYTSARIKTQGKKAFQFGRIDIRAILPKGKGIWPAFWLMPQDNVFGGWPRSGEIDMMEYIGSEISRVLGTVHFGPGPNSTYISRNYNLPSGNFNDGFHVFSLEWKTDEIKWYVDNVLFSTIKKADLGGNNYPFNEKFYMIMNLAVGGNLPGPVDATTTFPQWLIVDYIRLFQ